MENKDLQFNNISMKIFSSNDWMKVTDVSFKEYIVEKPDANWQIVKTSKGFRLKFEFTNNKWVDKKIIYLQDKEVTDFLAVIYWLKKKWEFMRNKPTKKLTIENQWEHSFLKFQMEEQYAAKVDVYSAFQISNLGLAVIAKELKRKFWFTVWFKEALEQIKLVYSSWSWIPLANNSVTQTSNTATAATAPTAPVKTWTVVPCQWPWCNFKLDSEKHKSILYHSNNNFQKNLCFNCQKKAKWEA